VLLVGVCEHLCMCYVSFTFFFSCFSGYCLSDAIVHSLAFYRSVLTPQLLLHYILIMSLHFCTPCALTACTLTNLVLAAKLRIVTCYGGRSRCHISYSSLPYECVDPPTPSILHPYHVSTLLHPLRTHSMHIDELSVGSKAKDCDMLWWPFQMPYFVL
jgi:hypothetical protein